MDPTGVKAQRFFEMLGLGPDAVRLKWNDLVKTIKETPLISDEQIAKAKAYSDKLINLGRRSGTTSRSISATKLFPAFGEDLRRRRTKSSIAFDRIAELASLRAGWSGRATVRRGAGRGRQAGPHATASTRWLAGGAGQGGPCSASRRRSMTPRPTRRSNKALKAQADAGAWRGEDVAHGRAAGQSPEDNARLLQNQTACFRASTAANRYGAGTQKRLARDAASQRRRGGDDFHQYIQKVRRSSADCRSARPCRETPPHRTTGATELNRADDRAHNWPQIRAMKFAAARRGRAAFTTARSCGQRPPRRANCPRSIGPRAAPAFRRSRSAAATRAAGRAARPGSSGRRLSGHGRFQVVHETRRPAAAAAAAAG